MADQVKPELPDRNLALELVSVTEAAALGAGRWMGRGDKNSSDHAAVEAMRLVLNQVGMDGVVVIGEGEKDEAPMLYNGEAIGDGTFGLMKRPADRGQGQASQLGTHRSSLRRRRRSDVTASRTSAKGRTLAPGGRRRHDRNDEEPSPLA